MGWKYKKLNFKRAKLASQVDSANEFSPKAKTFFNGRSSWNNYGLKPTLKGLTQILYLDYPAEEADVKTLI